MSIEPIDKPNCTEFKRLHRLLVQRHNRVQAILDPIKRNYAGDRLLQPVIEAMHDIDGDCAVELNIADDNPEIEITSTFEVVCKRLGLNFPSE